VRRLTPFVLLAVLALGSGLGIGLGLSEAPTTAGHPGASGPRHHPAPHRTPTTAVGPAVAVPDVVGESPAAAAGVLASSGLDGVLSSPATKASVVLSETPVPGTLVASGSHVLLVTKPAPVSAATATTVPSATDQIISTTRCGPVGDYQEGDETFPEPGYVLSVTNATSATVKVAGWTVSFTEGGQRTGTDEEGRPSVTPTPIEPGKSTEWTVTPGDGPWSDGRFTGNLDVSPGTTCAVVSVTLAAAP
jgi:hypothetical protein